MAPLRVPADCKTSLPDPSTPYIVSSCPALIAQLRLSVFTRPFKRIRVLPAFLLFINTGLTALARPGSYLHAPRPAPASRALKQHHGLLVISGPILSAYSRACQTCGSGTPRKRNTTSRSEFIACLLSHLPLQAHRQLVYEATR